MARAASGRPDAPLCHLLQGDHTNDSQPKAESLSCDDAGWMRPIVCLGEGTTAFCLPAVQLPW
jgi:hypothetical protein